MYQKIESFITWVSIAVVVLVFAIILLGCATVPHVEPTYRDTLAAQQTVVRVVSNCYGDSRSGTGVVINERYVLTAAHVVKCHAIPTVRVELNDGRTDRMVVIKENAEEDIAKLELRHAGRFGLDVPPPILQPQVFELNPVDYVCVYTFKGRDCDVLRLTRNLISIRLNHGDSGAPVYDSGRLVGLVIRDVADINATRITLVGSEWLEGT